MRVLTLFIALALVAGCKPRKEGKVRTIPTVPSPSPTIATLQSPSPKPVPLPTESPTPPVKNVAAKTQPTPKPAEVAKAVINSMPSVQATRWNTLRIQPIWEISANKAVMLWERTKSRYEVVEKQRSNGVPATVLFALHYRESTNNFDRHPHEGSSLQHRTRYVPKGRLPPPKNPPYKWEVSAEDAYYVADRLQGDWTNLPWAFEAMERFNGMGYRKRGHLSPYVYSGSQFYKAGKFVADGRYSASAVDKQLGTLAILKRMQQKGTVIAFDK